MPLINQGCVLLSLYFVFRDTCAHSSDDSDGRHLCPLLPASLSSSFSAA